MVDITSNDTEDATHDSNSPPREAPLTEDTVQTEEMQKAGIIVNTAMRIVICLGCRSVIQPASIYSHISRSHSLPMTRRLCEKLTSTYKLHKNPLRPGKIVNAIYGLDIFPDYMSCDNCGAAFQKDGSMTRHRRESSDCHSATHARRYAQSYASNSGRMFFGVTLPPDPRPDTHADPIALLKKSYSPTPFHAIPIKVIGFRDANHFLSIEKWLEYVEGMTGEQIWHIVRENEPDLREFVKGVVDSYAKEAVKSLGSADNSVKVAIGDYNG